MQSNLISKVVEIEIIAKLLVIIDKEKSFQVPLGETEKVQQFVIGSGDAHESTFNQLLKEVQSYLGENEIFGRDAAIGSHRWAEVPVRVIGDSAAADLALYHLLPKTPLRSPKDQPVAFTVYLATKFTPSNASKFGLKSNTFSVFHKDSKKLIIGGNVSISAIRQALMNAAAAVTLSKVPTQEVAPSTTPSAPEQQSAQPPTPQSIPLPLTADSVVVGDKVVLVFNTDNSFLSQKLSFPLFGAHNHFWTSNGLVKAWRGVTQDASSVTKSNTKNKFVETTASG
jgi:hypothetical protein